MQLLRRDGALLHVRGVDMLDGTPVLDIKRYFSTFLKETFGVAGWRKPRPADTQPPADRQQSRFV